MILQNHLANPVFSLQRVSGWHQQASAHLSSLISGDVLREGINLINRFKIWRPKDIVRTPPQYSGSSDGAVYLNPLGIYFFIHKMKQTHCLPQ